MKIEGYKLNGYDATYRKAVFNVNERGNENRVLEITEVNSGTTFLLDLESAKLPKSQIRSWRSQDSGKKRHGKELHFGGMGFFKELEYNAKKKERKK